MLLGPAIEQLGSLVDEVVFVGAAVIGLWVNTRQPLNLLATDDIDVIVVASRSEVREIEQRLSDLGFRNDSRQGAPLCRYVHHESGLVLDVMPIDEAVYGFTNPWFQEAYDTADRTHDVRIATPQMLLATKLAAWQGRGNDDLLASKDVRDCFTLIDGRDQIAEDVKRASSEAQAYIRETLREILDHRDFDYAALGSMAPYGGSLADAAADRLRQRIEQILAAE